MFGLGPGEMIAIACTIVILFGAGKLPKIGEGMGRAIVNFKSAVREHSDAGAPAASHTPRDKTNQ